MGTRINNKGFTLIELLAVMVILISISLVAVGGISASLENREEKECREQQELAIGAAKIYFSLNGGTSVSISELNSGEVDYFKSDKKIDKLKDGDTITFSSDGYVYTASEGSCADSDLVTESSDLCTIGTTYENCLLNENRPSSLWTSTLDNDGYRFVGTNPNNYICFGTNDSTTCTNSPNKYMYRIIQIYISSSGNKYLKLIKNTKIGTTHEMDDNFNTNNNWAGTTLYSYINGSGFLTNTNYSYLQDSTWLDKIRSWTYRSADTNLNGYNSSGIKLWELTPSEIYCFERKLDCNTQTGGKWVTNEAKIGLMYVSDYVLSLGDTAVSSSKHVIDYKSTLKTGWMFNGSSSYGEWTMMRGGNAYTDLKNARFYTITKTGYPYVTENRYGHIVRPVFYISANEIYDGGTGTKYDPYMISID